MSRAKHFCFLNMPIEYYSPVSGGAISTVIMETARGLIARGHKVSILTIGSKEESYPIGEVHTICAKRRDELGFTARKISAIRRRLAKWDYACYEYYRDSFCAAMRRLSPAPDVVVTFNDFVSPQEIRQVLPPTQIFAWLHNECFTHLSNVVATTRVVERFFTCSGYVRDWSHRHLGIPLDKFAVVHNGVDSALFHPREDYLTARPEVRILFVGRIDPNKGPDLTAEAVLGVQREGLPATLTVAGGVWFYSRANDSEDPFLQQLLSQVNAAGGNYLGHVERRDLPAVYREHDVVCVLSRSQEPFGLVALEAMASGCAVIASDRGGLPEACGGAAILVNPADREATLNALRSLVESPTRLKDLKMAGVTRASKAPWSGCAEMLERYSSGPDEASVISPAHVSPKTHLAAYG